MLLAGFDIGGTKIGICLGTEDGKVLAKQRIATEASRQAEATMTICLQELEQLRTQFAPDQQIAALGAACPGPMSAARGCFLEPPNMPGWHNFQMRDFLKDKLDVPIRMMNDADATMLAEHLWGAARAVQNAIYLTMSTGMGSGLLLNGQVYEGTNSLAGEIGHLRLAEDGPVGFGRRGSVEGYLSGPGIVQVAEAEQRACLQRGESSWLCTTDVLEPQGIFEAARVGDVPARRVVDEVGDRLGQLMAILTDILNPQMFVLGTIGTAHYDLLAERARAVLSREAIGHSVKDVTIERSGLADRSNQAALAVAKLA